MLRRHFEKNRAQCSALTASDSQRAGSSLARSIAVALVCVSLGLSGQAAAQSSAVADLLASTPVRVFSTNPVTSGGQGVDFGAAVALDRDLLVVGAPLEDSSATPGDLDSGAVYVFERHGASWLEIQKLRAPVEIAQEQFGTSVAVARGADLDGPLDYIIVGAPRFLSLTGRAHVFMRRPGGSFMHETVLQLDNPEAGDRFGTSVAIDWFVPPNTLNGDPLFFVVVGAPNDDDPGDPGGSQQGSMTIFQRAGGPPTWTGGGALTFYGLDAADTIGSAVAMGGPAVIAAGEGIDVPGGFNDGGALSLMQANFTGTGFNYAPAWELQPSGPLLPTGIGDSAAAHVGVGVLGAPLDDTTAFNAGKVYVFDVVPGGMGTTRFEVASLLGTQASDALGTSVGVTGSLLVAGATGAGPDSSGQVVVFERGATVSDWTHAGEFDPDPPDPPFECSVGSSVAAQEGTVVIGCPANRAQDEGVYVYFLRVLFEDGFESSDTGAWSLTIP